KIVYVSPDGALGVLPYAAIDSSPTPRYFVFTPSASTLALLSGEKRPRTYGRTLAIGISNYGETSSTDGGLFLGRRSSDLPQAEAEAKAVADGKLGDMTLLGAQATEEGFATALSKQHPWGAVHFAVHGTLDTLHPTLSSLVLNPSDKNDGDLTAFEIHQMD